MSEEYIAPMSEDTCQHSYTAYLVTEAGFVELNWQEGQEETLISRELLEGLVRDANAFRRM